MPTEDIAIRLEQYKLAVEMADRVSSRRQSTNSFFFTIISGLTVLHVIEVLDGWGWSYGVAILTLIVCALWWVLLGHYRCLNAAKFKVIKAMEVDLPYQMYTHEEHIYQPAGFIQLSKLEQSLPWVFALANLALAITLPIVNQL